MPGTLPFKVPHRGQIRCLVATTDVKTVVRTVALLECLSRGNESGASLAALSRASNLNEATALRYLMTLVRLGLAERIEATGHYRLGLQVYLLGERALGEIDPRRVALPFMEELRRRHGETVNLGVLRDKGVVLIEVLEGTHSIKKGASIGETDQLHSTGLGKATLAYLPVELRRSMLRETGLRRFTANTLTTLRALESDLEGVRARKYAMDREETELGLNCVAAPIFDRRGMPSFALSVSGPASRMSDKVMASIGRGLVEVARQMSRRLGCPNGAYPPVNGENSV